MFHGSEASATQLLISKRNILHDDFMRLVAGKRVYNNVDKKSLICGLMDIFTPSLPISMDWGP